MKIGWNGKVVDAAEAVISAYDHGFLYGMGLFETFRTYNGQPYLLDRHLNRLADGCRQLGIPFDNNPQTVGEWIKHVLEVNGLDDGYVRLTVSAGVAELGLPSGDYEQPNTLVLVKRLPQTNDSVHMRGRELQLLETRRNTPEGAVRFKSLHYMNNIIAKRELTARTSAATVDGLMLSEAGWVAEGIVSNLFFLKSNIVCTPALVTGILPGITRGRVLELARDAGYATQEGLYNWSDLLGAEEIWMTNSIQELAPVTGLLDLEGNRTIVGDGEAGAATRRLLALYRQDANGNSELWAIIIRL